MLLDLSKLIAALEGHTAALLSHAAALVSGGAETVTSAPRTRGRKAAGEEGGKALTAEQIAAASAAPSASTAATAQPAVTSAAAVATADKPVVTQPTLQQVADGIIAYANSLTGGRDKAVAILAQFGAKKVPELKPEQFAGVLAAIAAANAPAASDGLT